MDSNELYLVATMLRVNTQGTEVRRQWTMLCGTHLEHIIGHHLVMLSAVIMFRPICENRHATD